MPYAIMQHDLETPSTEKLVRALRVLPQFAPFDAETIARDAYGILVKNLSQKDAERLHRALQEEGVFNAMVDERELVPLQDGFRLVKAALSDDALVIYDALQRPQRLQWSQVVMIAAGCVETSHFQRVETERVVYRGGPRGGAMPIVTTDVSYHEQMLPKCVVEIFVAASPARHHIAADDFSFDYLGKRLQKGPVDNYLALVEDLLRYAPNAILNRGASLMKEEPGTILQYPGKHAFEEEIVWHLWHARRARDGWAAASS
jgi:hypothetical protein